MNHSYSNIAKVILDRMEFMGWLLCTSEWWLRKQKCKTRTIASDEMSPFRITIKLANPYPHTWPLLFFSKCKHILRECCETLKIRKPDQVKAQCQDYFCTLEHNTFCASKDSPVKEPTFTNPLRFRLNIKCYNLSSSPDHSHYHCCFWLEWTSLKFDPRVTENSD